MSEQVMKEINSVLSFLHEEEKMKTLYPESLSEIEIRLAVLLASLGESMAQANKERNDCEAIIKFEFANNWNTLKKKYAELGEKITATALDNEAEEEVKFRRMEYNYKNYNYERLRNMGEAIVTIINSLKDRIKAMQKEELATPNREANRGGGGNAG